MAADASDPGPGGANDAGAPGAGAPGAGETGASAAGAAWQPVLDPAADRDLAAQVEDTVAALTEALAVRCDQADTPATRAWAYAEHALLRAYLARAAHGQGHEDVATSCLDEAIDALARARMGPTLYQGFVGIAWIAEHVQDMLGVVAPPSGDDGDNGDDDGHAVIDAVLIQALTDDRPWIRGYDLVSGLVGIGVYALERMPRPSGTALLERVVAHLGAWAEDDPAGLCFRTRPEHLRPAMQARFPHGCHDLGVAHGTPGAIALLARAHAAGVAPARALAGGATRWLLARRLDPAHDACFPARLDPDGPAGSAPAPARTAWCYGDPGIAVALLGAARRLGAPDGSDLEATARAIARQAALRPMAATGVQDAALCHGAAGLAHLFQRLFQATGEELFRDTARSWIARTLDLRQPGAGIAGYLTWGPDRGAAPAADPDGAPAWHENTSFLSGATGIALALLASVAKVVPAWDRLLLADL